MFKKVIGKKCLGDAKCTLKNQLQDTGFVICPECGGDLTPEVVENKRAQALVTLLIAICGLCVGLSGYGWLVKSLSPLKTVEWLIGRIQIDDSFRPTEARQWVSGDAVFYNNSGLLPRKAGAFLYEVVDGKRTSTFRDSLAPNTLMKFDVASSVPVLYMFYCGDDSAKTLFPNKDDAKMRTDGVVSIPDDKNLIRLDGGPSKEHFVLVAARKSQAALENLRQKPTFASRDLERVVTPLESDPDAYVLHIYIPHA